MNYTIDQQEQHSDNVVSHKYVAPRTALEQQLCEIWQQVIGIEKVGIDDNFHDIGGDFISAIRLVIAYRRILDVDIPMMVVYEQQTISNLITRLEQLVSGAHAHAC